MEANLTSYKVEIINHAHLCRYIRHVTSCRKAYMAGVHTRGVQHGELYIYIVPV